MVDLEDHIQCGQEIAHNLGAVIQVLHHRILKRFIEGLLDKFYLDFFTKSTHRSVESFVLCHFLKFGFERIKKRFVVSAKIFEWFYAHGLILVEVFLVLFFG